MDGDGHSGIVDLVAQSPKPDLMEMAFSTLPEHLRSTWLETAAVWSEYGRSELV